LHKYAPWSDDRNPNWIGGKVRQRKTRAPGFERSSTNGTDEAIARPRVTRNARMTNGWPRCGEAIVADETRAERRKERREMHIDRRKSDIEVIERVIGGLRAERIFETGHDRPKRSRARNKGG
jgi:hypothetical protein